MREAIREGANYREISEEIGRTGKAVRDKISRMGLGGIIPRGRPPDSIKRARLIREITTGMSLNKIAALLGISSSAVCRMVTRLVEEGILIRNEGKTQNCRYSLSRVWVRSSNEQNEENQ